MAAWIQLLLLPVVAGTNLTVFHVNPSTYAPAPLNMDTGDALGDMYFDLRSVGLPIECAHPSPETGRDCDNQEVVANDLVVTKLVLDVNLPYGDYGRCNICVNGTDHHGNNSCVNGVYWCSCGGYSSKPKQCGPAVGKEDLVSHMGHHSCRSGDPNWACWRDATAKKTGGNWYSTTSAGYCGDGSSPPPPGCMWSVKEVVKVVNKSCSDDSIYSAVENAAAELLGHEEKLGGGGACFDACTDSGVGAHRNVSSPCWIECFYNAALGPEAGQPGGSIAGLPLATLLDAWNKPFLPVAEGGCPPVSQEQSAWAQKTARGTPSKTEWHGFPGFDF